MSLTPEQKKQLADAGYTEEDYLRHMEAKNYDGKISDVGRDQWLVPDQGRPPRKGDTVTVNGREARVVADRRQLTKRGQDKFMVVFV